MLITEKISDDFLAVKCNYSLDYVERFRQVPGARFSKDQKVWLVPIDAFIWYEDIFKGEIIYKTPRWVINGDKPPDYSKMYSVDENIAYLPPMKLTPFDYQKFGIKFMEDRLLKNRFVICADDVGLGKTPQAIGTMYYLFKEHKIKRVLIACKKSLKRQWVSEIGKFTDIPQRVPTLFVEGTVAKRKKTYAEFTKKPWGVMVTNYHTVMNDTKEMYDMNFDLVIIDEAHCVKARNGEMNKALTQVANRAKFIMFLTGTPIMSKPEDIFGVVQIADPKYFGKWPAFEKKHIKKENHGRYNKTIGFMQLDELRDKVQNIVIRRTEHEVTIELPETIPKKIECDIDNTQIKIQDFIVEDRMKMSAMLDKLKAKPVKTPDDNNSIISLQGAIKGLTAAAQACADDPRLFFMSKSVNMIKKFSPLIPTSYKMSSKNEALVELVQDILDSDHKVIIFSKFERATRLIQEDLERALKVNVLLYTGAVDDDQREINIELFKNDVDYNTIIMTDAGAEGLNLQMCNHVVNYDQPDTPAIKIQRAGRARRVGSKHKCVFVYDLITIDSKDVERLDNIEKASSLFDGLVGVNQAQSEAIKQAIAKEA